jgi:Ca2+-binding RTX toxin-like protein
VSITQTNNNLNIAEGGATDTYSIVLNGQPSDNVIIQLEPDTQVTTEPTSLTFTPANWDIPQTVTVTAVDDTLIEGNHTGIIAHTISSIDPNYNVLSLPNVIANIADNDFVTTIPIVNVFTPTFTQKDPGSTEPSGITPTDAADGDYFNFTDNNDGTLDSPISLADLDIGDRTVRALSGDDVVVGTNNGDRVQANAGADHITGLGGDDLFWGGQGMDSLYGNAGNDTLNGNRQSDSLVGGEGDDLLYGGKDRDSLDGGSGNDTLQLFEIKRTTKIIE